MRSAHLATAAVLFFAAAASLAAQQPGVSGPLVPDQAPVPKPVSTWNLVLPGAGLGVAGFAVGALIGAGLTDDCSGDDMCQLTGAFLGGAVGGTLGMSLGVHLGNHRKGSFALDALTGAAIWGAGIGLASVTGSEEGLTAAFILIPIAQLATNVAVERAVGRHRAGKLPVVISLLPRIGGGMNVTAVLRY